FAAENVVVKDILASNLDVSTLEIISASHDYRSTLTDGNKLEFFFEGINLPPESTDEPGSHGFVAFKIKPTSDVVIGSVIENTAEIFFDFNFPIVTNTVATTFIVLGNNSFDFEDGILLYPNPAANTLNINFKSLSGIASVRILNQLGQLVKTIHDIDESRTNTLAVEDLTTGTYFVQITSSKGTSVKKVIKL
ncbi:MAG TPA: T9SS type A sorting domain-containing protein, partial [Flavobacterium sp.]